MLVEYHNLYIHFVLKTLHRLPLITSKAKPGIERYISGIIKNCNSRMYAIYANPEHVHILISISPAISANELINHVAFSTEQFIKKNQLLPQSFAWQEKCSAFTVSKSAVPRVIKYIRNQAEHHRKISFQEECRQFLEEMNVSVQK